METKVDEIADGIFRLSTYVPEVAPPAGFTFNQFLIRADQPLLFHCGMRALFPLVSAAARKLIPLERLRWIAFGHLEADESGAMNEWLGAVPGAQVVGGQIGVDISITDLAIRPPRKMADGEVLDLGGKRVRHLDTPHVPHGWDSRMLFEETTRTLLCGDLFSNLGNGPAVTTSELVGPALETERMFLASALTPNTAPTIRRLAKLEPTTLAVMHGSSFSGSGQAALEALATGYAQLLAEASRG